MTPTVNLWWSDGLLASLWGRVHEARWGLHGSREDKLRPLICSGDGWVE